jgi:hypothetical protein
MLGSFVYSKKGRICDLNEEKENPFVISGKVLYGPTNSLDHALPRFLGTSGELLETTNVQIDDNDNLLNLTSLSLKNASSFTVNLSPSPLQTENLNFVLPQTDGFNGYVLTTDGSGNLSFTAAANTAEYTLGSSVNSVGSSGTNSITQIPQVVGFATVQGNGISSHGLVFGIGNTFRYHKVYSTGIYEIRLTLKVSSHSANTPRLVTAQCLRIEGDPDYDLVLTDTATDTVIGETMLFFPPHTSTLQYYQTMQLFCTLQLQAESKIYFSIQSDVASSSTTDGILLSSNVSDNSFSIRRVDN